MAAEQNGPGPRFYLNANDTAPGPGRAAAGVYYDQSGDPPASLDVDCVTGPLVIQPFALRHHPADTPDLYTLAGHVHPAVRLTGPGRQRLRLPCFVFGNRVGVLPAFGPFTGAADVEPGPGDRVFAVADGAVVEVPAIIP